MSTILVTGATGTVGQEVVNALLESGVKPRIGLRTLAKGAQWAEAGAQVVPLDYDKPGTLMSAMEGVDTLFLLVPFVEEFVTPVEMAVNAAREAGVSHIVKLSASGADPEADFFLAHQHGQADLRVKESGLGWTILQPTFFQNNIVNFAGDSIRTQGAFYGAAGDGKVAYISARDIGRVASTILQSPTEHNGQTYALTGPSAHSEQEVAGMLSGLLGKDVQYVNLTPEQLSGGMREAQLPEWRIEGLVGLEFVKANGWAAAVSPAVEQLLGAPGEKIEDFLARHKAALEG